jgi:peptidoglycan-N-acetylglucosamine deacetylase
MKKSVFWIVLFCVIFLCASEVQDKLNLKKPIKKGKSANRYSVSVDDGPHRRTTEELLELVKPYGKLTFFVTGEAVEKYPDLIRKIHERGHEVEIHGYSHRMMTDLSWQQQKEEILKSAKAVEDITGEKPHMFRPPWGSFNESTQEILLSEGMELVIWDLNSMDYSSLSEREIIELVLSQFKPGCIMLFHDADEYWNPQKKILSVLPVILSELKKRGCKLVTIDELISKPDPAGENPGSFFMAGFCFRKLRI